MLKNMFISLLTLIKTLENHWKWAKELSSRRSKTFALVILGGNTIYETKY